MFFGWGSELVCIAKPEYGNERWSRALFPFENMKKTANEMNVMLNAFRLKHMNPAYE